MISKYDTFANLEIVRYPLSSSRPASVAVEKGVERAPAPCLAALVGVVVDRQEEEEEDWIKDTKKLGGGGCGGCMNNIPSYAVNKKYLAYRAMSGN